MKYFFVALAGIAVGSAVNAIAFAKPMDDIFIRWYTRLFYEKVKYIIVELGTSFILIMLYRVYSFGISFFSYAILFTALILACFIDVEEGIIPDKIVIISSAAGIVLSFFNTDVPFLSAVSAGIMTASVLWLVSFITKEGLGVGDVKLYASAAVYLGFEGTLSAIAISTIASGIFGAAMLVRNPANRKRNIPFAPFILIGSLAAVFI
ncbi:MAG: prepilin peptidase [Caulobacteraceae bacterium]